jgi:urease accessory protein
MTPLALSRLLQLASPMLPVGAYSYSQGLESAIEGGAVHDPATARDWIGDVLDLYLARFELPILWRMHADWRMGDAPLEWNARLCAGRDTAEARAETLQTGYSLLRLIDALKAFSPEAPPRLRDLEPVTFTAAYAWVSVQWDIPVDAAVQAFAWSWAENQIAVAMKAIPIGQVAGQRILLDLGARIPELVAEMADFGDDDISNFAPGLSIAGCLHETQYSRLFRS